METRTSAAEVLEIQKTVKIPENRRLPGAWLPGTALPSGLALEDYRTSDGPPATGIPSPWLPCVEDCDSDGVWAR